MYLAELRSRAEPIRVGVVGIGRMGRGVVDQVSTMPGMRLMAAADVDLGRAEACLSENGAEPVVTDQPGAIVELAEWAQTLGFRVVCAGRGTVLFTDDHHATPDTYREQAERNQNNPKMYCSFRDGTKSQTEMAAVSNVLRMPPEVRGMHEPYCRWQDLGRVFSLEKDGGILRAEGVVDMANAVDPEGR